MNDKEVRIVDLATQMMMHDMKRHNNGFLLTTFTNKEGQIPSDNVIESWPMYLNLARKLIEYENQPNR